MASSVARHCLPPGRSFLLLATSITWLSAAETSDEGVADLKAQIERLSKQVAELSGDRVGRTDLESVQSDLQVFKDQYAQDREKRSPVSARGITISGLIQGRWTGTTITGNRGTTANSFDIPLAQVAVAGNLYRDYQEGRNLSFNLSLSSIRATSLINYYNLPASGIADLSGANATVSLSNAWVRYSAFPTVDAAEDQLSITLGQQQVPFGVEAAAPEEIKPTIRGAQGIQLLGLTTRQIGLLIQGDFLPVVDYAYDYRAPLVSYALGIFNGNGQNGGDDNPNKDLFGRLAFAAPVDYFNPLRGLSVGVSAYLGTINLTTTGTAPTAVGTGVSNRYGFDVTYAHNPYSLTYEYVIGVTDSVGGTAASQRRTRASGHQATAGYLFGEQFVSGSKTQGKWDDAWPISYQPYVRYDLLDRNTDDDVTSDRSRIISLGLNVFFAQTTKFQIQASRARAEQVGANGESFNELVTQFQYGF